MQCKGLPWRFFTPLQVFIVVARKSPRGMEYCVGTEGGDRCETMQKRLRHGNLGEGNKVSRAWLTR